MNKRSTDRIDKQIEVEARVSRVWRTITDYREFGSWFRVNLEGPFVVGEVSRGQITYPGYEHVTVSRTRRSTNGTESHCTAVGRSTDSFETICRDNLVETGHR